MKKIIVIGSISIDNVIYTKNLPQPGVTVHGESFITNLGGKGANQACAIKFLGGDVVFYGAIGDDDHGEYVQKHLKNAGLTAFLKKSKHQTGIACITIDMTSGENRIVVIKGANEDISKADIDKINFKERDILLLQLENKLESTIYAMKKAKEAGLLVVLNPAPYAPVPSEAFKYIDYFIPNEHELEQFTPDVNGDYLTRAKSLVAKGIKHVIVTLGEHGSLYVDAEKHINIEPHKVHAVDTTAAGDSYCGAFVTALSQDKDVLEAMRFASKASSITVTRKGAISSLPKLEDLK